MLDVGWSELLVIGVVALIVVGPKDLPILFRQVGEFTGKMRSMAREFTSAMDRAADEAGMRDIQRSLRDVANPRKMGLDALHEATRDLREPKDTPFKPGSPIGGSGHGEGLGSQAAPDAPAAQEASVGPEAAPAETGGAAKQDDTRA